MGNHEVNCTVCGEDLRGLSSGCAKGCPGENVEYREKLLFWSKNKLMKAYWVKGQIKSRLVQ